MSEQNVSKGPMCEGDSHVYRGRTDRKWPFDGQWCLCRKQRWSWRRHRER